MINFPSSPVEGVDYIVNGKIFIWNGVGFVPKPISSEGGGHTIKDSDETFTQRAGLKFTGNVIVTDDNVNGDTVVNIPDQTITVDAAPTDGSNNPVASNGVFDALALKVNTSDQTAGNTSVTPPSGYTSTDVQGLSNEFAGAIDLREAVFFDDTTVKAKITRPYNFTVSAKTESGGTGTITTSLNAAYTLGATITANNYVQVAASAVNTRVFLTLTRV